MCGNAARPLSVRLMIATEDYDATLGFSEAASTAVTASELAAVVALNTCPHVPAIEEMEKDELKIENKRCEEKIAQELKTSSSWLLTETFEKED